MLEQFYNYSPEAIKQIPYKPLSLRHVKGWLLGKESVSSQIYSLLNLQIYLYTHTSLILFAYFKYVFIYYIIPIFNS